LLSAQAAGRKSAHQSPTTKNGATETT
jgi:hypothetical protein